MSPLAVKQPSNPLIKSMFAFGLFILSISQVMAFSDRPTDVIDPSVQAKLLKTIEKVSYKYKLAPEILKSIATIESGINPYAINANGEGFQPKSLEEALHIIQNMETRPWMLKIHFSGRIKSQRLFFKTQRQAELAYMQYSNRAKKWDLNIPTKHTIKKLNVKSTDIGVMQINFRYHGHNFKNKEDMFNTEKNIEYSAQFMSSLIKTHKSIEKAVAHYHSNTHKYQKRYLKAFRPVYKKQIQLAQANYR